MHIVTKIALGAVIPRIVNELYNFTLNNRSKLFKAPVVNIQRKLGSKDYLKIVLYRINNAQYVSIEGTMFKIKHTINTEGEKKLHLVAENNIIVTKLVYNLLNPDDLNIIANAVFHKLVKV